jgi:hypothetical protein
MDIVNWDALKKGLLIKNSLESTDDLVLVSANTTYKKRGDLYQTYAVPASALGGGGGGGNGITQLIGEVTAGPGIGIQTAIITPLAVTAAKIANNAVTNAKIANDAVTTAKILNANVTLDKIQNIAANTFLANATNGLATVQAIATNRIPLFSAAIGGAASNTTFLRGDGAWATPPGGGITTLNTSGLISGGPITAPSGTVTTNMNTGKLVGRFSVNSGEMEEISIGNGLQLNTGTGTLTATATPSVPLTQTLGTTVDGSGGTVTVGLKGYIKVPYACTITGWTVISTTATPAQAIQFDIWRRNGALPTVVGDSLIGGGGVKPRLTAGQQLGNSVNLNNWSTSLAAGDYLSFRVDSATIVSWAILQINVTRV